jgi:hypothetical protein
VTFPSIVWRIPELLSSKISSNILGRFFSFKLQRDINISYEGWNIVINDVFEISVILGPSISLTFKRGL